MSSKIKKIHSFLVKPMKKAGKSTCIGVEIPLSGALFNMLDSLFDSTDDDCKIDIQFISDNQTNPARDLFISYSKTQSLTTAEEIAQKLEVVTTGSSGMGLLFIILGEVNGKNKLVVSRFPADSGIVAEEASGQLNVALLERVFMKSIRSYKAVAYKNLTSTSGVWKGKAVDRQITDFNTPTSKYWINDFLNSDFLITAAHGSKRLAEAIRAAANNTTDLGVKEQIIAAGVLLPGLNGQAVSIDEVLKKLNLSGGAAEAVRAQVPSAASRAETFRLDADVFSNIFKFKSVVIDNGVMISANASDFDNVVASKKTPKGTTFSTTGKVVNQKIQKQRSGGVM